MFKDRSEEEREFEGANPAVPGSYFLRTARLGFRWWQSADLDLARGLWDNPEVTRLIGGPFSTEQVERRLQQEVARAAANGIQYWPMFLLSNDDFAGCCGLRPYGQDRNTFELGFHLRRVHWGKGYAREAAQAVIDHAFSSLDAKALFAGHHPENEASRRLLEKLGFQYERDERYAPTGLLHRAYFLKRSD